MKTPVIAIIIACVSAFAAAARADVTVVDNDKTVDVDCAKDPAITLVGNHLTITTRGVCTSITVAGNHETVTGSATSVAVMGNHNTITLAAADEVTVDGNNNTVTVRKSLKLKAPRVANRGSDNHVTQSK